MSGWMPGTGRCLLDTNIIIALFAGEESVLRRVEAAGSVFVSVIVHGEQPGAPDKVRDGCSVRKRRLTLSKAWLSRTP